MIITKEDIKVILESSKDIKRELGNIDNKYRIFNPEVIELNLDLIEQVITRTLLENIKE